MHVRTKPHSTLKTYSHLAKARKLPSDYELVTSNLLYHPSRGFEVNVPLAVWYERYQSGSPLSGVDWDTFVDPRETTYAKYTSVQRAQEAYVDGIFQRIEDIRYDAALSPACRTFLASTLPVLRFPMHGLQMIASYVGQMAPSGRLAVVFAFQAADEVRRIQRIAYRMAQLAQVSPGFGATSREVWEKDPAWQPLRETIERALVTYDWGEAFVALDLCIKPVFDELFLTHFAERAKALGDDLLPSINDSFYADARWSRSVSRAMCELAIRSRAENRDVLRTWVATWSPRALGAVQTLCERMDVEASVLAETQDELLRTLGVTS